MTPLELAEKDLKKAELNLERARVKPNSAFEEVNNLTLQVSLRKKIVEAVKAAEVAHGR